MDDYKRKEKKEKIFSFLTRRKQTELNESNKQSNAAFVRIPTSEDSSFTEKMNRVNMTIRLFGIAISFLFLILFEFNTKLFRKFVFQNLNGVIFKQREHATNDFHFTNIPCEWEESVDLESEINEGIQSIGIVGFPESGMRLVWRLIEAYTGYVVGDEWNYSNFSNWPRLIAIKTIYPHPDGIWSWGDALSNSIYSLRTPLNALRAVASLKYELDGDEKSAKPNSFQIKNGYSTGATLNFWKEWRDKNFEKEIDRYSWMIDFWTMNGYRRSSPHTDPHCVNDMALCTPLAFVDYQVLENGTANGFAEAEKISHVLEMAGANIIAQHDRACAYNEVLSRTYLYGKNRIGPDLSEYQYTERQLRIMMKMLESLISRYSASPWNTESHTVQLVQTLSKYMTEVEAEYLSNAVLK